MRNLVAITCLALAPGLAHAAQCRSVSAATTLPVLELYTSEGCDSCPPADRWLSAQFPPGRAGGAVPLAFHVDYWDRLGWRDRFGSASFTARQYDAARAQKSDLVYTPQLLVQGRDVRGWRSGDAARALGAATQRRPLAEIELGVSADQDRVWVDARTTLAASVARRDAALFVAYVDSGLVSEVSAGENRGVRLTHDHVVRALQSAVVYSEGATQATFSFRRPDERGAHATIVGFVQNRATGDVLQAVALALDDCR